MASKRKDSVVLYMEAENSVVCISEEHGTLAQVPTVHQPKNGAQTLTRGNKVSMTNFQYLDEHQT